MTDHYQRVTDQIVALLETGDLPWRRSWETGGAAGALPRNAVTGRAYRGVNVLLLTLAGLARGSHDPRWCTYKQAEAKGWQVRRGERAQLVFLFRSFVTTANGQTVEEGGPSDDAEEATTRRVMMRAFPVFHASQLDGIPAWEAPTAASAPWRRPEAVQAIVDGSAIPVRVGGRQPCYIPSRDEVWMPRDEAFRSREAWASVLLHELGHATGHASRLNRDLTGRYGQEAYAMEELRAELASAFLGAELGLPCELEGHASYVQSWLRVLKNDKREVFRASADAQRIADWLLQFAPGWSADGEGQAADLAEAA